MDVMDGKLPGDKKSKKKIKPTLRFELDLPDSTDTSCPEYSFVDLVRETLKERKSKGENDTECQDLLEEEEEKERNEAEAIAQYYEIKYGATAAGQKHRRKDKARDLVGAGYGYDDNDPFVDDSEAYDEIVPATLTTQHGGFYINTGKLNFRTVSDQSDTGTEDLSSDDSVPLSHHITKKKKKRPKLSAFCTDESEGEFKTSESGISKKKRKKLNNGDLEKKKKRKISLNGKDKVTGLKQGSKKIKKPTSLAQKLVAKAKAAQHMMNASVGSPVHTANGAVPQYRKSSTESISSIKSKELVNLENKDLAQVAKQVTKQLMNIGVGSDSVMKNGSEASQHDGSKHTTSSPENFELPPNLPQLLGDKIESLKKLAKSAEGEGKLKFFSNDVNQILLGIEESSQGLRNKERKGVYQHIAQHLPCSKDTLLKRVKKLQVSDSDQQLKGPIEKLKVAVNAVMTSQIEAYIVACDTKSDKFSDKLCAASTDEDDECESMPGPIVDGGEGGGDKVKRTYAPRRKFKWDDNLRQLLCDVVRVKMNIYERFKVREKQNPEEYLKAFLETTIKPLWPKPWMQSRILFKESRSAHHHLTLNCQKQKKTTSSKKVPSSTKDTKSADILGSKLDSKDVTTNSAGQSENATKTSKKQLIYGNSDIRNFKPTHTGSNVLVNSNKNSHNALVDLTGSKIDLLASIEGDNSPSPSSKVVQNNISKVVDKVASNTWKIATSKLPVKSKQLPKTMSTISPAVAIPVKPEKTSTPDAKMQSLLGFDGPLMMNPTTMEQYASDLIKIMMSPNPRELPESSLNYLGMQGMTNYDAISNILGLKPEDMMPKKSDDKFEFKITSGQPKPAFNKSGPLAADFNSKKTQSWVKNPSNLKLKTGNRTTINLADSKGYSSMPTTPVGTPSLGEVFSVKNLPTHNTPVPSSNFVVPSVVDNSKFISQRQRPAQRAAEKNSVSPSILNNKVRKSSPEAIKVPISPTSTKNSDSLYSAARAISIYNQQGSQSGHSQSSHPRIDLNRAGFHMMSPGGFIPRGGPGKAYTPAFASPIVSSFPAASSFKPSNSPAHKFVSTAAIPRLPFSSSNYSYPQVKLENIQANKTSVNQAQINMKGNTNR